MVIEGMDGKCVNCRFFAGGMSECRRHAPRSTPTMLMAVSQAVVHMDKDAMETWDAGAHKAAWPEVSDDDWCGEYELRDG